MPILIITLKVKYNHFSHAFVVYFLFKKDLEKLEPGGAQDFNNLF